MKHLAILSLLCLLASGCQKPAENVPCDANGIVTNHVFGKWAENDFGTRMRWCTNCNVRQLR